MGQISPGHLVLCASLKTSLRQSVAISTGEGILTFQLGRTRTITIRTYRLVIREIATDDAAYRERLHVASLVIIDALSDSRPSVPIVANAIPRPVTFLGAIGAI